MITRVSIRNQIISALEGLTLFTTVASDATRNIEQEPFTAEECPALLLTTGSEELTELISFDEHRQPFTAEIYTTTASTSDQPPEDLFSSICTAIIADPTWGGYADGTGSPTTDQQPAGITADLLYNGSITFNVYYTTASGLLTPYS